MDLHARNDNGMPMSAENFAEAADCRGSAPAASASMLVGVTPTDTLTFVAMTAIFFLMTALSSWLPARRAAALDPTVALREGLIQRV